MNTIGRQDVAGLRFTPNNAPEVLGNSKWAALVPVHEDTDEDDYRRNWRDEDEMDE